MPELAGVLLDMDGVQVDSEPHHDRSFQRFLDRRALTLPPGLDGSSFRGLDDRTIFERLAERMDLPAPIPDLIRERTECFLEEIREQAVQPMEGLLPLLEELREHRIPMALCSSSQTEIVEGVIEQIGTRHFYAAVVTGTDVEQCKPAPDIFLTAARTLGVDARDCVAIEDSVSGIAAARAAGALTVLLRDPTYPASHTIDATLVIDSLTELKINSLRNLVAAR